MQAGVAKYDKAGSTGAFAPFNFKQRVLSTRPEKYFPWSHFKTQKNSRKLVPIQNFMKTISFYPIILWNDRVEKQKLYTFL